MTAGRAFHVVAKPGGAMCDLECGYCFYLPKRALYPRGSFRMPDETLERFVRQFIEAHSSNEATFDWQGGEPSLMGIAFFRRAVELQKKHARPGMTIRNSFQTNGISLDREWCAFFRENDFLVGVSLDGPGEVHDLFRRDRAGNPTFDRVMAGAALLREHGVWFNILAAVHSACEGRGREIYRFFRDTVRAPMVQFIPIVERAAGGAVTQRSVTAKGYGAFLIEVFDEWVQRDVGEFFVQLFDVALGAWLGCPSSLCVFSERCGGAPALEHNGDLYSCDHFVDPEHLLGNIAAAHIGGLAASPAQKRFGNDKLDTLPGYCRGCGVRFACNGGCPKDRFLETPDGEPGLNYLCEGHKAFFSHIDPSMKMMAELIRRGRSPAGIMGR